MRELARTWSDGGPERKPLLGEELLAACRLRVLESGELPREEEEDAARHTLALVPRYAEGPPRSPLRCFVHPDGRRWDIEVHERTRRVRVKLPGEAPFVRDERFASQELAVLDAELLADELLADGFVERDDEPGRAR